jgi:tRNA(Ile)-lysidine synthase TilS/MesJ
MFSYGDRILVAVSGGKDSLALWKILLDLGYRADGLYVGLGIGGYSSRSEQLCRDFAERHAEPRARQLHVVDLADEYGYTIPAGSRTTNRPTCGVCGLSKRYVFNRVAVDHGYDVMATGHNLDDEAATLLGNVIRWQDDFLSRQRPVLPATGTNQVRKVKPLYRLSEREMAAYCVVTGLDYVVEECPLVDGNTGHELKEALNLMERTSPGLKAQFLFGFLDRAGEPLARRRRRRRRRHDRGCLCHLRHADHLRHLRLLSPARPHRRGTATGWPARRNALMASTSRPSRPSPVRPAAMSRWPRGNWSCCVTVVTVVTWSCCVPVRSGTPTRECSSTTR